MMVSERSVAMRAAELLPHDSKPAPGDLRFVQAFVNTLEVETGKDHIAEAADLERWLRTHGSLGADTHLGPTDVEAAQRFREALRKVLTDGCECDEAALAVLDEVGKRARLCVSCRPDGGVALVPASNDVWSSLGELLAVMHAAQQDGTWQRLKVCASDDCQWVFYDASKNRSAHWCSMKVCGNRAKVREHRARQKGATA
jgi:predicted RNA-binding Zn ribbon-like protein